jgi:hypothetical protein
MNLTPSINIVSGLLVTYGSLIKCLSHHNQ